jgi:hypothetical protein
MSIHPTNPKTDYKKTIADYTAVAYKHANINPQTFNPLNGYTINYDTMHLFYIYYQNMFLQQPKFLWMGLARLTGGQVLWGMNNFVKIAKDPCAMTINIVQIAKEIFEKMAWQHELYLADYDLLINTVTTWEADEKPSFSYAAIWQAIKNGNALDVAVANKELLFNEQNNTVQAHYEVIRADAYSSKYLWLTRFTMRKIHPYHNRFIVDVPIKDVTKMKYRWYWINKKNGMWDTWVAVSNAERIRLVALPNEQIINHAWL